MGITAEGIHQPDARDLSVSRGESDGSRPAEPGALNEGQGPAEQLELERTQLLTRLLVGLVLSGEGRIWKRLRRLNSDVQGRLQQPAQRKRTGGESASDLVREIGFGMHTRGQKTALRGIRGGVRRILNSASWSLLTGDAAAGDRTARPVRRPRGARLRRVEQSPEDYLDEGRPEGAQSRSLAPETVDVLMGEFFEHVVRDAETVAFIQDLIGQQSLGLAGVAVGNTRKASSAGDDPMEGLVRRLFMRKPCRLVPASRLQGVPRTTYEVEPLVRRTDRREQ